MKAYKPAGGFTLIELLVVIGIIAILAALLFPVFHSAQNKSRQAACEGNLHQIGIALKAYQMENGVYPPQPRYDGTRYWGGLSALYPDYISDKSILLCPDDPMAQKKGDAAKQAVYSSYNGMVDPTTGKFVVDSKGPELLYNYCGYNNDGYDSYTVPTAPPSAPTPGFLASQGLTGRAYPRLMNRYAPDNTIITHCPYHRSQYGTNPSQQMDIVLRLNGKTEKDNVAVMAAPDAGGLSLWVQQK